MRQRTDTASLALISSMVGALVLLPGGCKSKPHKAPNNEPSAGQASEATGVLDVAAPAPPAPGKVDFSVAGAVTLEVHGVGSTCDVYPQQGFSVRATSADVLGSEVQPRWTLWAMKDPNKTTLGFSQDDLVFSREVDGAIVEEFTFTDEGLRFGLKLPSKDGKSSIRAEGTIQCSKPVTENQVSEKVVALLADLSGQSVRRFSTVDFGRDKDLHSISVVVAADAADALVDTMRKRLGSGWVVFMGTTRWLGTEQFEGVEVVVGPGTSQLDALRLAHSDAVNYGLETEALYKKLASYDQKYQIDVFHAETDTIEFKLHHVPKDLTAFAKDLYEFCPDIVDQGVGSIENLEKEIRRTQKVFLWWD